MQEFASLPPNSSVGILYFGSPSFTQVRLQERIQSLRQAAPNNLACINHVWVADDASGEDVAGFNTLVSRAECLCTGPLHCIDISLMKA